MKTTTLRRVAKIAAVATVFSLSLGCWPKRPEPPRPGASRAHPAPAPAEGSPAQAKKEYDAARAVAARDAGAGVEKLSIFLARWPTSPLADPARLRIGQLERARGRSSAARAAIAPMKVGGLSAEERREAFELHAALAADAGDRVEEIVWLSKLRAASPDSDDEALVDVDLDQRIAKLDAAELGRGADKLGDRVPAARLRLRQGELALARRDAEGSLLAAAQASRLPLTADEATRLAELERRTHVLAETGVLPPSAQGLTLGSVASLPPQSGEEGLARADLLGGSSATGTIGVVLPLSGQLAKLGEQSLQGVLLAAGIFPPDGAPAQSGGVRIVVRDSQGRADAAATAVAQLAADPTVSAVVGPLGADEAEAAAAQAETAGLPLLTLSGRESVTAQRTHVFRVGVTPRDEANALGVYAAHELGLKRFGVLYPDDAYGRGMKDVFQQIVVAYGGQVTGVAAYRPGTTDFEKAIRELVGGKLPTPEAPGLAFDALFIPDAREKALLIAPQLAVLKVAPLRLLGPRGWQHPDLLKLAGRQVEGAVMAEPFDAGSNSRLVQDFVREYQASMQATPDVFAAQAFDATNLVLTELAHGTQDREAVREGLLRVREAPGVAGSTSVRPDGNAEKRASLIGVVSGQFVRLQGP